jgi:hypothetical protein
VLDQTDAFMSTTESKILKPNQMANKSIPLELTHQGIHYKGWATPSETTHPDGYSKSYRVVLNEVFFGDLPYNHGNWTNDQQMSHDRVVAVGHVLESIHKNE